MKTGKKLVAKLQARRRTADVMSPKGLIIGMLAAALVAPAAAGASTREPCGKIWRADSGSVRVTQIGKQRLSCRTIRRVARNIYSDPTPFRMAGRTWATGRFHGLTVKHYSGPYSFEMKWVL